MSLMSLRFLRERQYRRWGIVREVGFRGFLWLRARGCGGIQGREVQWLIKRTGSGAAEAAEFGWGYLGFHGFHDSCEGFGMLPAEPPDDPLEFLGLVPAHPVHGPDEVVQALLLLQAAAGGAEDVVDQLEKEQGGEVDCVSGNGHIGDSSQGDATRCLRYARLRLEAASGER
jgi:hypothetical protein